jgi:hypothetical protein
MQNLLHCSGALLFFCLMSADETVDAKTDAQQTLKTMLHAQEAILDKVTVDLTAQTVRGAAKVRWFQKINDKVLYDFTLKGEICYYLNDKCPTGVFNLESKGVINKFTVIWEKKGKKYELPLSSGHSYELTKQKTVKIRTNGSDKVLSEVPLDTVP